MKIIILFYFVPRKRKFQFRPQQGNFFSEALFFNRGAGQCWDFRHCHPRLDILILSPHLHSHSSITLQPPFCSCLLWLYLYNDLPEIMSINKNQIRPLSFLCLCILSINLGLDLSDHVWLREWSLLKFMWRKLVLTIISEEQITGGDI